MVAEPVALVRELVETVDDGAVRAAARGGLALAAAVGRVDAAVRELVAVLPAVLPEVGVGAAPVGGVAGGPELVAALRGLLGVRDVVASAAAQVGEAVEASGAWRRDGATGRSSRDYVDWWARVSRQGAGAAKGQKAKSTALRALPAVKEATTDAGSGVTDGHVAALGRVFEQASPAVRKRLVESEAEIVSQAKAADVTGFARQLRARVNAWDTDSADRSFAAVRTQRFLRLSPAGGAMRVEGLLDPVAGETVRVALEALTPVPSAEDERTSGQRSADALELLAHRALSYGQKNGAQVRPGVVVLMREETMALARRRQEVQDGAGSAGGAGHGTRASGGPCASGGPARSGGIGRASGEALRRSGLTQEPPLAQLENGTALPPAALEVLLCDSFVRRVVLDARGLLLDSGQGKRTFQGALRAGILARDRHCQFPGCSLRASWCEVHHIRYWKDGGATSRENGITLCRFHHHRVHADAVSIMVTPDGFEFTGPGGQRIGMTSRLGDEILVPRGLVQTGEPPRGSGDSTPPQAWRGDSAEASAQARGGEPECPGEPREGSAREPGEGSACDGGERASGSGESPARDPGEGSAHDTGESSVRGREGEFPDGCQAALW